MESIVSKCIEQLLDLMDYVENVGIEEIAEIISELRRNFSCEGSHEVVNNFLLFNF
jgi:uncharacterized protein YeeX (DUF496 family)